MRFGKNWKLVEAHVGTRTGTQVRSHAQKFFIKLEKDCSQRAKALRAESQPAAQEEQSEQEDTCPLKGLVRKESQKDKDMNVKAMITSLAEESRLIEENLRGKQEGEDAEQLLERKNGFRKFEKFLNAYEGAGCLKGRRPRNEQFFNFIM
jgi:hypothetical protein